jgi:DNA-binding protein HU-beta
MNRNELIDLIANEVGLSKAQAGLALETTLSALTRALRRNDPVSLPGFGTFYVAERAARIGHHPQTGDRLEIPAARVPRFKASQILKDAIQ